MAQQDNPEEEPNEHRFLSRLNWEPEQVDDLKRAAIVLGPVTGVVAVATGYVWFKYPDSPVREGIEYMFDNPGQRFGVLFTGIGIVTLAATRRSKGSDEINATNEQSRRHGIRSAAWASTAVGVLLLASSALFGSDSKDSTTANSTTGQVEASAPDATTGTTGPKSDITKVTLELPDIFACNDPDEVTPQYYRAGDSLRKFIKPAGKAYGPNGYSDKQIEIILKEEVNTEPDGINLDNLRDGTQMDAECKGGKASTPGLPQVAPGKYKE